MRQVILSVVLALCACAGTTASRVVHVCAPGASDILQLLSELEKMRKPDGSFDIAAIEIRLASEGVNVVGCVLTQLLSREVAVTQVAGLAEGTRRATAVELLQRFYSGRGKDNIYVPSIEPAK